MFADFSQLTELPLLARFSVAMLILFAIPPLYWLRDGNREAACRMIDPETDVQIQYGNWQWEDHSVSVHHSLILRHHDSYEFRRYPYRPR